MPEHSLATLPPHFPNAAMRDHLQIVVSDPKAVGDGTVYGVVGGQPMARERGAVAI